MFDPKPTLAGGFRCHAQAYWRAPRLNQTFYDGRHIATREVTLKAAAPAAKSKENCDDWKCNQDRSCGAA
jgi:hypothetical protein